MTSLLRDWSRERADAAVVEAVGADAVTWRGLFARAEALSEALSGMGLSRRRRLIVAQPDRAMMAIDLLCALSVAGACPVDPACSDTELLDLCSRIQASGIVVDPERAARLRQSAEADVLIIASTPTSYRPLRHSEAAGTARWAVPTPDDDALVLCTSGSTGESKIVVHRHAAICASMRNIASHLALTTSDVGLHVMPLHHSHGLVGGLLSAIYAGGSVVFPSGLDDAALTRALLQGKPSWYTATPPIHNAILGCVRANPELAPALRLRFIRSTSTPLPQWLLRELEKTFAVPIIESFGTTEWSQMASNPVTQGGRKPLTVGRPTGVEIIVADRHGRALPAGELGEVCVRGKHVADHYEGDPEATRQAYRDGWFKTGDLAYFDSDGYLTLSGRLHDLINRGGEKINPHNLEACLNAADAVAESVAFPVPHPTLGEDIAALVVAKTGRQIDVHELQARIKRELPAAFAATSVTVVGEIPRDGPARKVLRRGIHGALRLNGDGVQQQPRDPIERAVAEHMRAMLGRPAVDIFDSFFAQGGDSLTGLRLISRLNREYGIKLAGTEIFYRPSVAELAELVRAVCAKTEQ